MHAALAQNYTVGCVAQVASVSATRPGPDDSKTLKELKFQTGDFLDVAIF